MKKRVLQLFYILFVTVLTVSSSSGNEESLFRTSGANIAKHMTRETEFQEYIRQCEQTLLACRPGLTDINSKAVLQANMPFELLPPASSKHRTGILLIHGLSNSPYETRSLAEFFQSQGFHVRSILLPGHGTVPGDLLSVTLDEFIEACRYGLDSFGPDMDTLYMGGNSLGGALSLYMALTDKRIKGIFLFAPSLGVKRSARLAKTPVAPVWLSRQKESDYARYESFCSNAAAQAFRLTQTLDRLLSGNTKVLIPVFISLPHTDMTVNSKKTISVFSSKMSNPLSRMVLYTPSTFSYKDTRILTVSSVIPEERIIDFSHLSVIIPPENPHYGRNGDYRLCYFHKDPEKLDNCLESDVVFKGEYTKDYLKLYTLKRLTYNPYFREMTDEMKAFINRNHDLNP